MDNAEPAINPIPGIRLSVHLSVQRPADKQEREASLPLPPKLMHVDMMSTVFLKQLLGLVHLAAVGMN